jgi:RNA polymerase sigma-70 factor (ECF subfamily)
MMASVDIQERTDHELLQAALTDPESDGARQAASQLLSRYQERVYVWCYRHAHDHERALDLAQEVLVSAYRNLGSFRERSQFSSWLFAIARNRCVSELRRPKLLYSEGSDPDALGNGRPDPAQALVERLDEEAIHDLIRNHLTTEEQGVLWLRCFERMPIDAITRVLAIRQASGARGVLQGARRKLRSALARREQSAEMRP